MRSFESYIHFKDVDSKKKKNNDVDLKISNIEKALYTI